jgi:ABC-type branched-subunit amino acid transport system ATPase component/branched-subunit amino acid ABC-type transport system permease component
MEKFLTLASSGAISGAIYSLIAVGLVLTYTATRTFNLGYGAIAYTTAYVYFQLHTSLGWPIVPAALVSVLVFAPALGLLLDRLIFRALAGAGEAAKIMATVGILVALPAIVRFIVERLIVNAHWKLDPGEQIFITPGIGPSPKNTWKMPGGWVLDSDQLIVFVTAVLCAIGLWLLLRHTMLGLRMRAVVDRPSLAQLRGVNRSATSAMAWVIGTFLAGLAGVVGAPVFNSLQPNSYTSAMIVAIAAAVIGGLRSAPIAALGGVLLGVSQNLVTGYASFAKGVLGFNESVPYVILFAGLIVLNVDRSRRAGSVADEAPRPDPTTGHSAQRRLIAWTIGIGALCVYVFAIASPFWVGLTTKGMAFSLVLLSFVIVTGLGGMVSLAQSAFATAAGLVTGLAIVHYDMPFVVGVLIGVAFATALGVVVAVPALRLGGLPLALATLALALLGDKMLFAWPWLRNDTSGWQITRPSLIRTDKAMAVALLILIVAIAWLIHNVQHSATGRAIAAVRSAESAAACSGVSPTAVKLLLFATSAAVAGIGGAMLVTFDQRATYTSYPAQAGLVWLAAVVLWGVRRPSAAIVAGISVAVFPALLQNGFHFSFMSWSGSDSTFVADILFGLGAIQMASDPDGIFSQVSRRIAERKARREGRTALETAIAAEQEAIDAQVAADEARLVARARMALAAESAAAPTGETVLEVRDVVAGYGDVEVLHGIDLALTAGSVCALVGANGAGKSTLCSVVAGLVPATSGTVLLEGHDIGSLPAHQRARRELIIAPEARGIFPGLSVEDNLRMRLTVDELPAVYDRFTVLGERRKVNAGNLSGGEQQLLTLAPVVTRPPRVLIADEPTLGLAPLVVESLMALFGELRDQGVSLLLVEEKARRVLEIADQVAFLELGQVLWLGPRDAVDEAELGAAYLGASTR